MNAGNSVAYYARVTASSTQPSCLLSFSIDVQSIGNTAFGPPDFNLSLAVNGSNVSISSIDVYKR